MTIAAEANDTSDLKVPTVTALAIGLFAGALSGLFGVGGGILIVPALAIVGKMQQRRAHGTSLAATAPLAGSGLVGYALAGQVDWRVAGLILTGSLLGAIFGTHLLVRLPQPILRWGFVGVLVITAARMLLSTPVGVIPATSGIGTALGLSSTGLLSGAIAGLMGVGGGIIMVPAQVMLFDIPAALAKGTSLAVIVPTALVGSYRNVRNRNADIRVASIIAAAGAAGAFLGSRVSLGLNERTSSVLFGALLILAAARLALRPRVR